MRMLMSRKKKGTAWHFLFMRGYRKRRITKSYCALKTKRLSLLQYYNSLTKNLYGIQSYEKINTDFFPDYHRHDQYVTLLFGL